MSVHYQHLVVYGWQCPYGEFRYEAYEPYLYDDREVGDAVAVDDGMAGEYLFIGILQARSDPSHAGRATFDIHELSEPTDDQLAALDELCEAIEMVPVTDPTHHVFTHFC